MSRLRSRRLRVVALIGVLAIALPATVPEPVNALNLWRPFRWVGERDSEATLPTILRYKREDLEWALSERRAGL